ncbi:YIP1 family protein [Alteromonas sp. ASW11-36]|uniref:YIP1 family protein n=1 Tax=Alteromonas arenosi TaxID=3055817 RepID=A0ABT7SUZ1_9ALTE|nr:YIP1 family protein [Alteromonas sp. ASW11-36]MDM7860006.1 YIP1 family protein [Alteromonas sp. ASW11-36]
MSQVTNPIQACSEIFFKPNGVFAALNVKHNWSWIPFILVITATILPAYVYFNFVDFEWYREIFINANYGDISPNEQENYRNSMTIDTILMFTIVGTIVGSLFINAILAVYFNLVTKSDEQNTNGFTDWFGFTWWIAMPGIISAMIALIVVALATNHQLDPVSLSPTSAAFLFNVSMESEWFGWAQGVRIETFWTIYLAAVGISQWTGIRGNKTYIIAAIPYFLLWGIWGLITAMS